MRIYFRPRLFDYRIALILALFVSGCFDHAHKYEGYYFSKIAFNLRYVHQYWVTNSKPENFSIPICYPTCFDFTNVITVSNHIFDCRFAARPNGPPFGLLAITRDGAIIWINDKDNKVTVDPEKNGVDGKNSGLNKE